MQHSPREATRRHRCPATCLVISGCLLCSSAPKSSASAAPNECPAALGNVRQWCQHLELDDSSVKLTAASPHLMYQYFASAAPAHASGVLHV